MTHQSRTQSRHNDSILLTKILYGVAVGDALGFPYQFINRRTRLQNPVLDMGISRNEQNKQTKLTEDLIGLWSDDTSLTLCLAESLAIGYDLRDQAERIIAWHKHGYLSAVEHAFDVGRQTRRALYHLHKILPTVTDDYLKNLHNDQDIDANGNGALMRILPLILHIYHLDIQTQFGIVREAVALTHPHIRNYLSCLLYLRIAQKLIDGMDAPKAVSEAQEDVRHLINGMNLDPEDRQELDKVLNIGPNQGVIDPIFSERKDYISSSGYVIDSLVAALWCLLNSADYRQTVLKAVNLGDDTDSVAAIAGGLAALIYGHESIPAEWIVSLKKPEHFLRIITLYEVRENG